MVSRSTVLQPAGLLTTHAYCRALWCGSPPHQATLLGCVRRYIATYAPDFRLSADLDYFLRLSTYPALLVVP